MVLGHSHMMDSKPAGVVDTRSPVVESAEFVDNVDKTRPAELAELVASVAHCRQQVVDKLC
jgi:hypothetical protein